MIHYVTYVKYYDDVPYAANYLLCRQGIFYRRSSNQCHTLGTRFNDETEEWDDLGYDSQCRRWVAWMNTKEEAELIGRALKGVKWGSKKFHIILTLHADSMK